jgi:hypothetical protein
MVTHVATISALPTEAKRATAKADITKHIARLIVPGIFSRIEGRWPRTTAEPDELTIAFKAPFRSPTYVTVGANTLKIERPTKGQLFEFTSELDLRKDLAVKPPLKNLDAASCFSFSPVCTFTNFTYDNTGHESVSAWEAKRFLREVASNLKENKHLFKLIRVVKPTMDVNQLLK